MQFRLENQMRLASAVVSLVGMFAGNLPLVLVANLLLAVSYMLSVAKMEKYFQNLEKPKEDEDAVH